MGADGFYLGRPGVVSALGSGTAQTLHTLLHAQPEETLSTDGGFVSGRNLYFGKVRAALPALADVPSVFCSRNNRLLAAALEQIRADIQAACTRYGKHRVAVVIGTSTSSADENNRAFRQRAQGVPWEETGYCHAMHLMDNPAEFTAFYSGARGAAYTVSTACTSGARALISAARLLRSGAYDAVICGGADSLSLLSINGFAALEVLSGGIGNPFAAGRDGINIGEAAAVFVMTREKIHADSLCLLGYGASADAYHMSSPHPQGAGAKTALKNALLCAGLNPAETGWLNLHGTGTVQNDAMEAAAVAEIFGTYTACTATKPLSGHTLGAAGALEAAIVWAVLSRSENPSGSLPAQYRRGLPDKNLPALHFTAAGETLPAGRRIALSASYAFGGNNAVLVIGEM